MSLVISKRPNGRLRVQLSFDGDEAISKTQQQFKDSTDVNLIMKKYRSMDRAILEHGRGASGVFGDFSSFGSYQDALDKVTRMRETFMDMPSDLRNRFGNDPEQLVKFLDDPKNDEESIKLGLRVKPEVKVDPLVDEIKGLRTDLKPKKKVVVPDEE